MPEEIHLHAILVATGFAGGLTTAVLMSVVSQMQSGRRPKIDSLSLFCAACWLVYVISVLASLWEAN